MKIFAPAVFGAGFGVFALAMMVGAVAALGPAAIPSNGITVAVDTVRSSLQLMLLGWPVAALLGGLGGVVVGLIHAEATAQPVGKPTTFVEKRPEREWRNALATPIERKRRSSRTNSVNQPA